MELLTKTMKTRMGEHIDRHTDQSPLYEVVGQLGFWGVLINGTQTGIFDCCSLRLTANHTVPCKHAHPILLITMSSILFTRQTYYISIPQSSNTHGMMPRTESNISAKASSTNTNSTETPSAAFPDSPVQDQDHDHSVSIQPAVVNQSNELSADNLPQWIQDCSGVLLGLGLVPVQHNHDHNQSVSI